MFDPFFTVREALVFQSGYFGIRDNAAWVDVGWAGSFAIVVATWTVVFGTPRAAAPLAIAVVAWGARLASHLATAPVVYGPDLIPE